MGRKVLIRVSYANDARFLLRLIEAVQKDNAKDANWRSEAIVHLKKVAHMFLEDVQ